MMNPKHIFLLALMIVGTTIVRAQSKQHTVKIQFSNIRSNKGSLRLGIFKTEEEFAKEKSVQNFVISKEGIKDKSLIAIVNLPEGTYGISILDDENNNSKMDYNMVGIPKEGFGFSNYYHSGFSKPKLSQFTITINKGVTAITCKFRYI